MATKTNAAVWPDREDVREGVIFGPDGNDWVGTLKVPKPDAAEAKNVRLNQLRRMAGLPEQQASGAK